MPLFLLLFHALSAWRRGAAEPLRVAAHRVAPAFLLAAAVWQFVGSGVLGLLINLPVVNYCQHGT